MKVVLRAQVYKKIEKMEFEDLKVEVPLDEENTSDLLDVPVKKYQNKDSSNFVTGFDVTSKEAEEKRLKRARRFGLNEKATTENTTEIEALPSRVQKLPVQNQDATVRPDALLLFGVSEMSTKDVFDYFQDYIPGSIEWIDDISCVVVWDDENSAKRAFANMGMKFTPAEDSGIIDDERLENVWRIGVKHAKSKQLMMRYATTSDKKAKGAGSRSLYYLIHGRPEQEKRKAKKRGLVSSSRRRRINADQSRVKTELGRGPEVEILDGNLDDNIDSSEEEMDVDEPAIKVLISEDMCQDESPTGNMYADQKKNGSIHSRLNQRSGDVRNGRLRRRIPNSAKMDEEGSKNNMDVETNSDTLDLRQKLKSRKQIINSKTRPSLSIEVTEDW